jgi:phthalate 4,5-cis-dihydrodiol dehydrogenase
MQSHGTSSAPSASQTLPPIGLGIAGLGLAGAMMIRAAAAHPHVVLRAGADPLPRPREAFARDFQATAYPDFEWLCQDPSVEAIYIASPHQFHARQAIAAIAAGKHVLVEKPLALTLEDCDAVIASADRSNVHLIVGHTHAFDPNIRAIREMVRRGEIGRLGMISAFNYTSFLYKPRRPEELDTAQGGGILFNQVTHQVEIVRLISGGAVRSVRANVGVLDPSRPTEGNCIAFLEFDNGAAASLVYSGYDFFDSDELHGWIGESGVLKEANQHGLTRRRLLSGATPEEDLQKDMGYGGRHLPTEQPHLPHFGTIIVTGERGELRLSADGIIKYDADGAHEIAVQRGVGRPGHGDAIDALWGAMRYGERSPHDARWGKATLEVVLAILRSARERREIILEHQIAIA